MQGWMFHRREHKIAGGSPKSLWFWKSIVKWDLKIHSPPHFLNTLFTEILIRASGFGHNHSLSVPTGILEQNHGYHGRRHQTPVGVNTYSPWSVRRSPTRCHSAAIPAQRWQGDSSSRPTWQLSLRRGVVDIAGWWPRTQSPHPQEPWRLPTTAPRPVSELPALCVCLWVKDTPMLVLHVQE